MAVVSYPPLRDEVWLISLDPTQGAEIKKKTHPCLIISPPRDIVANLPILAVNSTANPPRDFRVCIINVVLRYLGWSAGL